MTPTSDIRRATEAKVAAIKNSLAAGSAGDYTEYQRIVGMLEGIDMGMEIALSVLNSRLQIEEDD